MNTTLIPHNHLLKVDVKNSFLKWTSLINFFKLNKSKEKKTKKIIPLCRIKNAFKSGKEYKI